MTESIKDPRMAWRTYTGKVAVPTIIFSVVTMSFYALVIYMGMTGRWSLGVCCVLNTVLAYLIFTPLHEAVHGNISGRNKAMKPVEKIIGWLSGFTLTVPAPLFRYLHMTHHTHTNDEELDPDYWVASKNPFYVFLKCVTIIVDYYYFFFKDSKKQWQSPKYRTDFIFSVVGLIGFYVLFFVWGMQSGWLYPLFLWILPALIATSFLAFVFDYLPHHPHSVKARYLDTRVFLYPGFTILFLSQNLHLIHHLYPNIPFYDYPKLFKKIRPFLESKGVNIEDWAENKST